MQSSQKHVKRLCNRRIEFKMSDFTKLEDTPFFIPKDPSSNDLRHYGQQTNLGLILNEQEIKYLCGNMPENIEDQIYFDLKENGFNILHENTVENSSDFKNENKAIYRKNKHFNRKKNQKIGNIKIVNNDDYFDPSLLNMASNNLLNVFGVKGWNDYCLIQIKTVECPNKEVDRKIKKHPKSS